MFESSDPERLTEDPREMAKAAADVVMVAPRTTATGSFMVSFLFFVVLRSCGEWRDFGAFVSAGCAGAQQ